MAELGRPSKYEPEWMLDKVIELMSQGASKTEVAAELGLTARCFFNWQKEKDDFFHAVKRGEILSQVWWEKHGRNPENLNNQKFNSTLWYMNMKNRFRKAPIDQWTDRQDVDVTGSVSISDTIQEAARKRIQELEEQENNEA